jgi:hypothetical protein
MTDWSHLLVSGSIYALGFLGLFGITLLPLRAFLALRRNSYLWHVSTLGKAILLVVAIAAVAAISLSVPSVARVFRCLTETYCGANRASGWFFLAFIGVFYLAFEVVSSTLLAVARRVVRVAT